MNHRELLAAAEIFARYESDDYGVYTHATIYEELLCAGSQNTLTKATQEEKDLLKKQGWKWNPDLCCWGIKV